MDADGPYGASLIGNTFVIVSYLNGVASRSSDLACLAPLDVLRVGGACDPRCGVCRHATGGSLMVDHTAPGGGRPPERTYLDVPFAEKDQAKALGARWDPQARRWYDPQPPSPGLNRWAALPDVPDLLPGEDRGFGSGLFVDLIPSTCWFTNVRTCVSQKDWERLRRMITRRAGRTCEACGAGEGRAVRRWLEAHERWAYDERTGVQALRRLICLCSSCHLVTHFGHANVTGRTEEAFAHLCSVTGMDQHQAWAHVRAAEELWIARSRRVWELDLSVLTDAGVTLAKPGLAADRATAANQALRHERSRPAMPAQRGVPAAPPPPRPLAASPMTADDRRRGLWARITRR